MRKFSLPLKLFAFAFFSPAPLALAALAATPATAAAPAPATASPPRPNIVVILTDDQGWADIGYNNPGRVYTPNLDKLAATGARFSRHYVMPQCTPTRVAALTGRLPSRFGPAALEAGTALAIPFGTPTLASMLRAAGYETYLCGKWHLGDAPEHGPRHFGFDRSYGSLGGAVGMYDHRYRPGKFADTWRRDGALIPGAENGRHATDLVMDDAVRFLRAPREKPFFLYLAFHAPHTPLDERGRFTDQPTALDPQNPSRWRNEEDIEWFHDPAGIIQREPDPRKRLFLAALHHLDHAIGEVVRTLDETGLRESTLLLFSSDNGPQITWQGNAYPHDLPLRDFNQPSPLRGYKTQLWDGGILVPGLANWPARIAPGVIGDTVHIVDWFPTLSTLSGGPAPANLDGHDLSPALFKRAPLPPRENRPLFWSWGRTTRRWALRDGDWKIVRPEPPEPSAPSHWQLYDLGRDPYEKENVAAARPEIVARLHRLFLAERAKDFDSSPTAAPLPGPSP